MSELPHELPNDLRLRKDQGQDLEKIKDLSKMSKFHKNDSLVPSLLVKMKVLLILKENS